MWQDAYVNSAFIVCNWCKHMAEVNNLNITLCTYMNVHAVVHSEEVRELVLLLPTCKFSIIMSVCIYAYPLYVRNLSFSPPPLTFSSASLIFIAHSFIYSTRAPLVLWLF